MEIYEIFEAKEGEEIFHGNIPAESEDEAVIRWAQANHRVSTEGIVARPEK